jgi:mono/diheme cytochrome c family protein
MTGRPAALLSGALVLAALIPASAASPQINYALRCSGCHTSEGVSPPLGRIPPLKGAVGHLTLLPEGRRYIVNVPGIHNSGLGAEDTAALLNWMVATYGEASTPPDFAPFTGAEVARWRAAAPDDVMVLRAEVRALLAARGIRLDPYP